jgi:hypothetical protein
LTGPQDVGDIPVWDGSGYDFLNYGFDPRSYGAVGDGVTDDTAAIQAAFAEADPGVVYLAPGEFDTSIAAGTITTKIRGEGQLIDSDGNKRAPWFTSVSSAPDLGDWGSVVTAFNGDVSNMALAIEHRVTGAATLGQPASGYMQPPECSPVGVAMYSGSGWSQNTGAGGADGRTGLACFVASTFHDGLGDAGGFHAGTYVTGQKPGFTHFLANSAAILFNGSAQAGAASVYLNPVEINLEDNGFDVAGIGHVINLVRTNETGAVEAAWNGVRIQNAGSKASDVAFMAINGGSGDGFKVGLDLAAAELATTGTWINAAITMKQDQRIFVNAAGTDGSFYRRPSSTGSSYIEYNSGLGAMHVVTGGVSIAQLYSNLALFTENVGIPAGKAFQQNNLQVVGARQTGWTAPTGTLSRATFDQSTVTLPQLAQRVAALITDITAHGLIGA